MRISAKGRYALAAVTHMAALYDSRESITVVSISERLGISKIYLEQVFSLLKRCGIVTSTKGAQGGYQLAHPPWQVKALDILLAVETALFEPAEGTVTEKAPEIDLVMRQSVFQVLDQTVRDALGKVTLYDLATQAERLRKEEALMFYI
ncbi:MAG: Rrf2 family transcriptional regulator [Oscillospiraceae bacterium]|nr:Rrf2 family transcriptional regulator [Oscillospiraceae bacterium]